MSQAFRRKLPSPKRQDRRICSLLHSVFFLDVLAPAREQSAYDQCYLVVLPQRLELAWLFAGQSLFCNCKISIGEQKW